MAKLPISYVSKWIDYQ